MARGVSDQLRDETWPIWRRMHRKLMRLLETSKRMSGKGLLLRPPIWPIPATLSGWHLWTLKEPPALLPWTYHELGQSMGYVQRPVYSPWSSIYAKRSLEESVVWFGRICETRWLIDLLSGGTRGHQERLSSPATVTSSYSGIWLTNRNRGLY